MYLVATWWRRVFVSVERQRFGPLRGRMLLLVRLIFEAKRLAIRCGLVDKREIRDKVRNP